MYNAWPKSCGSRPAAVVAGGVGKGIGSRGNCNGFGDFVRSNVTVGKGAEVEMVAMLVEQGRRVRARKLGFIRPSALGIEPERSILAADEVVDAIAIAVGGNGWLWCPS